MGLRTLAQQKMGHEKKKVENRWFSVIRYVHQQPEWKVFFLPLLEKLSDAFRNKAATQPR